MQNFMNYLRSVKAVAFNLNLPGVQPFMRAAEINEVYLLGHTKPVREKQFYWKTSLTFLRVPD
jgi:hypothetical protein